MGEKAVASGEKSVDQLMEEMREGFRDMVEGRVDYDSEIIREKIETFREG